MGNGEKLAGLVSVALISLAALLAAIYNGQPPNWGPTGDVLIELAFGAGAAVAAAFFIVQRTKAAFPNFGGTALFVYHLALAVLLGPLAYVGLVALNLTDVSERGAIMVATTAVAGGKAVWEAYKNTSPKEKVRQVQKARQLLRKVESGEF